MSKIICDVCGTRYPDTAEQCPICGHIREASGKTAEDVLIMDDIRTESRPRVQGGRFSKSNVKKRNEGAVPYTEAPAKSKAAKKAEAAPAKRKEEPEFTEDEQNKKANTILNILLVVVILALLAVTGYIFMEHIMPNLNKPEATAAPVETIPETAEPTETEEPTFPCENLVLEESEVLLTEYEQKWLINVEVQPLNTTDTLTFISSDELIATVDSEGCVTALAEGEATITIVCGNIGVEYHVVCLFPGVDIKPGETPTDPPPTEPPKEMTVTGRSVNVRSGPGQGYEAIGKVTKGQKVLVYEIITNENGYKWARIENGWVSADYLE